METTTVNIELIPADLHAFSRYAFRTGFGRGRGIILFILSLLLIGGAFFFVRGGQSSGGEQCDKAGYQAQHGWIPEGVMSL